MKNIAYLITILCLLFVSNKTFSQVYEPINTPKIDNGNYNAIVRYHNYSTNTVSNYKLVVTVKNERVTAIHFPNEGSVHSGQNNEGYIYSGGSLIKDIEYDSSGEMYIESAKATVQVRDRNGSTVSFSITL